jgi:hypothetical protein
MGTYREHDGDKEKKQKNPLPFLPKTIKLYPSCVHAEPIIG